MIYYLAELVLLVALVVTSLQVLRMRRELQRMQAYQAEFSQAVTQTEMALIAIQVSLRDLRAGGQAVADELGDRIDAGERLLAALNPAQTGLASRSADRSISANTTSRSVA